MKELEKELWNYIDGSCTPAERVRIEKLLDQDPEYRAVYQELLSLDADLMTMDLEQPSMSFTRNVMEAIQGESVPASVQIDKRLIYGIGALFGLIFLLVSGILLYSVNWSEQSFQFKVDFTVPPSLTRTLLNSNYLTIFYLADVVLALYILDGFFRKRLLSKKL